MLWQIKCPYTSELLEEYLYAHIGLERILFNIAFQKNLGKYYFGAYVASKPIINDITIEYVNTFPNSILAKVSQRRY